MRWRVSISRWSMIRMDKMTLMTQEALQKGTPLDLHPKVFRTGSCAQTGLSKANVILHRLSDEPRFEIYVTISFADYLWNWLERACDEYGMAVAEP